MLEVPVSFLVDNKGMKRSLSTVLLTVMVFGLSAIIVLNFEQLFGLVITITTKYSQPLLGLMLCIFAGWLWNRHQILEELKAGDPNTENTLFWRVWPWYIKFVCPVLIASNFYLSVA